MIRLPLQPGRKMRTSHVREFVSCLPNVNGFSHAAEKEKTYLARH